MRGDIYATVGARLRARRGALGLTLEDLDGATGLHSAFIGQIERGARKCSLRTIAALASALDLPLENLFRATGASAAVNDTRRIQALLLATSPRERSFVLSAVRHLLRGLRRFR